MLATAASLDALRTAFKLDFAAGIGGYAPLWSRVATLIESSTKSNTYGWLSDFPRLREWIGDRVIKSISEASYVVQNRDFEATVGVKKTAIEDDELGVYKPMIQGLGQSAAEHPDEMVFALLAAGFTTRCWDGQFFFDTDHPVGPDGAATYSNVQAGGGAPWYLLDTTKALKPLIYQRRKAPEFVSMTALTDEVVFTSREFRFGVDLRDAAGFGFPQLAFASAAALNAANYEAARTAMTSQVGDTGRRLNVKPSVIAVGPSNRAAAKTLFDTVLLGDGNTNIYFKDVEVLEVPWLP